jgi:hypothetical protein
MLRERIAHHQAKIAAQQEYERRRAERRERLLRPLLPFRRAA